MMVLYDMVLYYMVLEYDMSKYSTVWLRIEIASYHITVVEI